MIYVKRLRLQPGEKNKMEYLVNNGAQYAKKTPESTLLSDDSGV